jgi:hypothetical protein
MYVIEQDINVTFEIHCWKLTAEVTRQSFDWLILSRRAIFVAKHWLATSLLHQ